MDGLSTTPAKTLLEIDPAEKLGRAVHVSKDKGRAERGTIPVSLFTLRENEEGLSHDRLSIAPEEQGIAIAKRRAATMEPIGKRSFYGWAVLSIERAEQCGRQVKASPLPDGSNDYHAEIFNFEPCFDDAGKGIDHAEQLSSLACWLPVEKWGEYKQSAPA